jgi:pyruvate,orthophosphate dikinase
MVNQLMRTLRLKGMANTDALAAALRISRTEVLAQMQPLVAANNVIERPRGYSLTAAGRDALVSQLAIERTMLDVQRIEALYDALCTLNVKFKKLMKEWQIRSVDGNEAPNDHIDAAYDAAVVERLGAIDTSLHELLSEIVAVTPRLAPYRVRFSDALAAIRAGDRSMMAAPIKDSYHTLWFELHEEFIDLCGRTRAAEAAAGRGD